MAIHLIWDAPEQAIIRLEIVGTWDWDDFYSARDEMHRLMQASAYAKIDFILDMRHSPLLPPNVLAHMRKVSRSQHAKSGTLVVVGAGVVPQALFQVMEMILPRSMAPILLLPSLEQARHHLLQQPAAARR